MDYKEIQVLAKKSGVKAGGRKSDMAKAVMGKVKSGALIWDGTQFELAQEDPGESSNSIAEAKVAPMVVTNDIVENVVLEDFPHFVGAPYLNEERGRSRERRGISARNFRGNSSKRVRSVSSSGYSGSSTDPEKRNMPSSGKNTGKRGKGRRGLGRAHATGAGRRIATQGGQIAGRRQLLQRDRRARRRIAGVAAEMRATASKFGSMNAAWNDWNVRNARRGYWRALSRKDSGAAWPRRGPAGTSWMLDAMQAAFEHRQKLVRLADQHGWDVAAVYDGQELASGSTAAEREADARRIAKAIKEAERRRKPTSGPIFRQPAPSQLYQERVRGQLQHLRRAGAQIV